MKLKQLYIWLFGLIVIEFLAFRIWIYTEEPDPSVSIGGIIIILFLVGVNLLLGLIIYFYPQRRLAQLFFINALLAPIIFHVNWTMWYSTWNERNYNDYFFKIDNARFEISLSKTDNYFSISDITNHEKGSTTGLFLGTFETRHDTIYLVDGQTKMKIVGQKLIGFQQGPAEILLRKQKE